MSHRAFFLPKEDMTMEDRRHRLLDKDYLYQVSFPDPKIMTNEITLS